MSSSILVGYATTYGSTQEIAEAVAATLREGGLEVDCRPASKVRTLEGYAADVLGAPLCMFRWHKDATHFLSPAHPNPGDTNEYVVTWVGGGGSDQYGDGSGERKSILQ